MLLVGGHTLITGLPGLAKTLLVKTVARALGLSLAGAHYHLAKAYWTARDNQNARQEVLAALEIAPGYREAQKLLLEVAGK